MICESLHAVLFDALLVAFRSNILVDAIITDTSLDAILTTKSLDAVLAGPSFFAFYSYKAADAVYFGNIFRCKPKPRAASLPAFPKDISLYTFPSDRSSVEFL
jgi:hypothetical protein